MRTKGILAQLSVIATHATQITRTITRQSSSTAVVNAGGMKAAFTEIDPHIVLTTQHKSTITLPAELAPFPPSTRLLALTLLESARRDALN